MKELIAFHGSEQVKAKYLARVEKHRAADEIIKGTYWSDGKGCAVGCTLHSSDHAQYEVELGIPEVLARLQDATFEGLPLDEAKEFPRQFLAAIPVGEDLSSVWPRLALWLLIDEQHGVRQYADEQGKKAIDGVAALYQRQLNGEQVTADEFGAAADAADAAAARSAAWAAADAAWAAADAAWAAAWSAAEAAADAAWAAAWSAAEAAADADFWIALRDHLLVLLETAEPIKA